MVGGFAATNRLEGLLKLREETHNAQSRTSVKGRVLPNGVGSTRPLAILHDVTPGGRFVVFTGPSHKRPEGP
jgi:hypothetical protein